MVFFGYHWVVAPLVLAAFISSDLLQNVTRVDTFDLETNIARRVRHWAAQLWLDNVNSLRFAFERVAVFIVIFLFVLIWVLFNFHKLAFVSFSLLRS